MRNLFIRDGAKHLTKMLVDQGYVVFRLDNRGAANRGKNFEDPLYRAMGRIEVRDQADRGQMAGGTRLC